MTNGEGRGAGRRKPIYLRGHDRWYHGGALREAQKWLLEWTRAKSEAGFTKWAEDRVVELEHAAPGGAALRVARSDVARASRREPGEELREAIEIVENEPLGYLTEREHAVLENFADRIVAKLRARDALAGQPSQEAERPQLR